MTVVNTSPMVSIRDAAECLARSALETLQLTRLREVVTRVAQVPFYRDGWARNGGPPTLNSLADLHQLPFTTKADLRQHAPLGLLAVPRSEVARIHGSSGTTGRPTFVAYTHQDLHTWGELVARILVAGAVRPGYLAQVAFGYGLFTGGLGLHYGIERAGAAVIPAASGHTRRQVELIQDLAPEVLVCTPSYALTLADTAHDLGIDPRSLSLRYAHLGGEPWSEAMRLQIETALAVTAYNNYGLSEIMGPGVSGECVLRQGMHLQEDHFLVECLDPDTLLPVADGMPGELVITTLTKEAMPLLRYRTRDIASLDRSPCACGRTTTRMSRISGRSDDMLIIRGVNVFPSQIETALLRVEGVAPHYLIEIDRPGTLDEVRIKIEMRPEVFSDRMDRLQGLRERLTREILAVAGIRATVDLMEPHSLERFTGKAQRVVDRRRL